MVGLLTPQFMAGQGCQSLCLQHWLLIPGRGFPSGLLSPIGLACVCPRPGLLILPSTGLPVLSPMSGRSLPTPARTCRILCSIDFYLWEITLQIVCSPPNTHICSISHAPPTIAFLPQSSYSSNTYYPSTSTTVLPAHHLVSDAQHCCYCCQFCWWGPDVCLERIT